MKFKLKHCLQTAFLTEETYSLLICKLVTDGYINTISMYDLHLVQMWWYIGVNERGEITVFDSASSFLEINEWMNYLQVKDEDYPNVLTKQQLEEYLK